jgi:hypothetical protein
VHVDGFELRWDDVRGERRYQLARRPTVADNGSNFLITGARDRRSDDNDLNGLKDIPGDAFQVVESAELPVGC